MTVELTVDAVTGALLDAIDDVSGVRSIAVDGSTLIIHVEGRDGSHIGEAVESTGVTVHAFTQRVTRSFDPVEADPTSEPFDTGTPAHGR